MQPKETHILIADSSPMVRAWLHRALARVASVVVEATNGVELLEAVAESGPWDLVVASRDLPYINGVQVLAAVRTAGDETPWLVLAHIVPDSVRDKLARLGNVALLDDPMNAQELLRLSRMLLDEENLAA